MNKGLVLSLYLVDGGVVLGGICSVLVDNNAVLYIITSHFSTYPSIEL